MIQHFNEISKKSGRYSNNIFENSHESSSQPSDIICNQAFSKSNNLKKPYFTIFEHDDAEFAFLIKPQCFVNYQKKSIGKVAEVKKSPVISQVILIPAHGKIYMKAEEDIISLPSVAPLYVTKRKSGWRTTRTHEVE